MTTYTDTQIIKIGGKEWTGTSGTRRVYLNSWAQMAGLEIARYGTGNISSASIAGRALSNAAAAKLGGVKVYLDPADGRIHGLDDATYIARGALNTGRELELAFFAELDRRIAELAPQTLTTREAAAQLGVSVRTVQRRAAAGSLAATKDARGRWVIVL